jgi:uncharacterized protein (TIGR03437 family)
LLLVACLPLFSQQATIVGTGYAPPPVTIYAAPGQLLTLNVAGLNPGIVETVLAHSLPLPTILAGITATMTQSADRSTTALPIFSVTPQTTCSHLYKNCGSLLSVVLQVPFSLYAEQLGQSDETNFVFLTVSDGVNVSAPAQVVPVLDNIHLGYLTGGNSLFAFDEAYWYLPPIVHASGLAVSVFYPAKPGEELVIYGTGFGFVSQVVAAGAAPPSPPPTVYEPVYVSAEYRANARGDQSPWAAPYFTPSFAGLVSGTVGVYQVNFTPPPPPAGTPACDHKRVLSNLTITVFSLNSSDFVQTCADVSGAPANAPAQNAKSPH